MTLIRADVPLKYPRVRPHSGILRLSESLLFASKVEKDFTKKADAGRLGPHGSHTFSCHLEEYIGSHPACGGRLLRTTLHIVRYPSKTAHCISAGGVQLHGVVWGIIVSMDRRSEENPLTAPILSMSLIWPTTHPHSHPGTAGNAVSLSVNENI